MADSTGRELTYGRALTAAVLLARQLAATRRRSACCCRRRSAASLANIAITIAGRVPVNLNFTAGPEAMGSAIEQCGIRTMVTSRKFLAKAGSGGGPAHGLRRRPARGGRETGAAWALLAARSAPLSLLLTQRRPVARFARDGNLLERQHRRPQGRDALAPQPAGQHRSDRAAFLDRAERPHRRRAAVLPLLRLHGDHLVPAGCRLRRGVPSAIPTDAKAIGELVGEVQRTFLLSTPTFCSTYTRKCSQGGVRQPALRAGGRGEAAGDGGRAFREKFGVELLEGYGCTEMSPVVAVEYAGLRVGQGHADGQQAGDRGTSAARRRGEDRRSGDVRAAAARTRKDCCW